MFDFGLRSKASQNHSNRPAPVISPTAEAELSALVIDESDGLESLREFLLSSQKRLEGVAKLDLVNGWIRNPSIDEDTIEEDFADATARVLERRQAASSNHIFVALVLFMATQDVSSSPSRKMILGYTNEALKIFPLLMTLSNRISCMQSIRGRELLKEVRVSISISTLKSSILLLLTKSCLFLRLCRSVGDGKRASFTNMPTNTSKTFAISWRYSGIPSLIQALRGDCPLALRKPSGRIFWVGATWFSLTVSVRSLTVQLRAGR
jgi:hypothetical protein